MIGGRVFNPLRRMLGFHGKLIVVGSYLTGRSGHYFNELLGYKTAGHDLGLAPHIIVPRTTDPSLVAALSADSVLDPLPPACNIDAENFLGQLVAFADGALKNLDSLWTAIEAYNPRDTDILFYPL